MGLRGLGLRAILWFTASFVFYIGSSLEGLLLVLGNRAIPHTIRRPRESLRLTVFELDGARARAKCCAFSNSLVLETTTRTTVILSEFADIRRSEARTEVHSEPL